ncbi:MAG: Tol-Pal system beta propeller repeat protein TolB [Rickettsiales bacterium]|nr:Tol-Pal system beta propeller repeat protein TolB [Rickettsiales bacterium]|tara:strand:+ start:758 stop:2053 length:1296 start_codon:yes stop_codon:yes gene_type:complete
MRAFVAFVSLILVASAASAQLRIDITRGHMEPVPVAITDLGDTQRGREIANVIKADLERSGLFRAIDKQAFIQQITDGATVPRFADWRQISAQALVTGGVQVNGDKMVVNFRLWDTAIEQQVAGKEFNTFDRNWRRTAHLIADEIYKRLTGEDGYFDSRIVYVAESGPATKRVKRLAIMDQDSENHKFLTDGADLVLTPRFSPSSQDILYMSYKNKTPRVYLRNLQTGREQSLGTFRGMSFAPRFSPDGSKMVMSIADGGNTEIVEVNLRNGGQNQLTNSPGIDTSPSYSPDGREIAFESDRGGSQQIYIMSAGGGGAKRISFGEGRYGTPVWSPRGDLIAFTKMLRGKFYIGVMRTDGSGERLLTESWLDEGPTWAPNGRVIIFSRQWPSSSRQVGRSRLYSVDVTGQNLREVPTPTDASDPAWSPLLPM